MISQKSHSAGFFVKIVTNVFYMKSKRMEIALWKTLTNGMGTETFDSVLRIEKVSVGN